MTLLSPHHIPRLLAALVAAAVLSLGLAAGPSQAKAPRDFIGVSSEDVFSGSSNYRDTNLSAQAAVGVGTIRQTFHWKDIETSPGHYNFGFYDNFVAQAAAHGIRILPILFEPPTFHQRSASGRGTRPPAPFSSMAAFASAVVHRYGRHGSLWSERPGLPKLPPRAYQVWNEPTLPVYWVPRPSARQYTKLLKVVGRAIKRADRRAAVMTAGLPPSKLRGSISLFRFIKQMYRAHGKRYFDVLAINSYAKNQRELKSLLRRTRRLMNHYHDRRAKIWITELGWATSGPRHRFNVGERGQARLISKSFRTIRKLRRRYRIRGLVYFAWRDQGRYAPDFRDLWGLHTGLLRLNGGFKPGYFSFKHAVSRIR